jgi:hypothetical protein
MSPSMPQFYVLSNHEGFYATFLNKPLIIGSKNIEATFKMRKILLNQKQKTNKWINTYNDMIFKDDFNATITLSQSPIETKPSKGTMNHHLCISRFHFDVKEFNDMYSIFNIANLFLIYDIHFNDPTLLLSGEYIAMDNIVHKPSMETIYTRYNQLFDK